MLTSVTSACWWLCSMSLSHCSVARVTCSGSEHAVFKSAFVPIAACLAPLAETTRSPGLLAEADRLLAAPAWRPETRGSWDTRHTCRSRDPG
jgi:hypothetical protein